MSRARDLSKLGNPGVFSVSTDNNVGVNSTAPVEKLNVVGVVSATSFYGDGSGLENLKSAGLGTAIIRDSEYGGEQIYYTNKALNITGNLTVDVPDSAEVAYTQYQEIVVDSGADFIVSDGDDFIPDILGIGTEVQQPGLLAGGGGRVRADNFTNKAGDGAPTFASGVVITGVATATTFDGNLTGNVTGNVDTATTATYATTAGIATNAQGLTGTPNILVGVASATQFKGPQGNTAFFYGDGSGLINVATSSITGINIKDSGSVIGVAGTVNFGSNLNVSPASAGIVTVTGSGSAALTVLTSNTNLENGKTYMLNASGLVLTLPASPSTGDAIDILNNVTGIHTVARNGSTIQSLSEDMEVNTQGIQFKIWYTGSTWSLF